MEKKPDKLMLATEVLQSLFENGKSPLSVQFIRWKLWKRWAEYVGPTMADVCEPVGYYRGVLYIWVKNASWMQQLYFLNQQLKENINNKLGTEYVTEIRFTMNRKHVPADAEASQKLKESINTITKK